MIKVNEKNLLAFIITYFTSIGCDPAEVNNYFTARRFNDGIVLNLPAVCLLPENKPASSKSNQTHIHVTSKARNFFYDSTVLDNAAVSTPWKSQMLSISESNIKALTGEKASASLLVKDTSMMTKIECRKSLEKQVQLSKISKDGRLFLDLRRGLYENDIIIFLKYRNSEKLFVLGMPRAFFKDNYVFETARKNGALKSETYTSLVSQKAIPVRAAIEAVLEEHSSDEVIESEDAISDAVYQSLVDSAKPGNTTYSPVEYVDPDSEGSASKSRRPITNPSLGREAIEDSRFRCSVDENHLSFMKPDGTPYLEVHHLIPLSRQADFKYKLDTKANIIPLCPNCHRMLHHGRIEDIEPILKKLYEQRIELLRQSGLDISFEKLKSFYS